MKKRMEEINTASNTTATNESTPLKQMKPKAVAPKSTRVKVGRKMTEAINPKFINSVEDWVSYSDRTNVHLGSDGSLVVEGDDGSVKTIPFHKGFDAIRGITMRSELLRKKSIDHLALLRSEIKTRLMSLQNAFVEKELELLTASRTFRESVSGDADGSLAAEVVRLNKELAIIHGEIQSAKYELQTEVHMELYPRSKIFPETHDDRVIEVFENTKMETTVASRTLGLDGMPPVPTPVEDVADADADADEDEDSENSNNSNSSDNNSNSGSNSSDNSSNSSNSNSNSNDSSNSSNSNSNSSDSNSSNMSSSNENESDSNSNSSSHDYFQELVDELKKKFETFPPSPTMTVGEYKTLAFTEERLEYYKSHIPDFNRKFKEACAIAMS